MLHLSFWVYGPFTFISKIEYNLISQKLATFKNLEFRSIDDSFTFLVYCIHDSGSYKNDNIYLFEKDFGSLPESRRFVLHSIRQRRCLLTSTPLLFLALWTLSIPNFQKRLPIWPRNTIFLKLDWKWNLIISDWQFKKLCSFKTGFHFIWFLSFWFLICVITI